jgi:PhoH-like ATPase
LRKLSDKTLGKYKTRNKEQEFALDLLMDQNVKLVTLVGFSGTGKTLTAIAAGLEQVIGQGIGSVKNPYKSLVVCRPIQPVGKDLGYLPGTLEEKLEPWIAPIKDNLRFLVTEGKRGKQAEDILKSYFEEGIIEVEAMAFIRGRSITDAFIIVDEAQNLSIHELKTILTRAGEGTKIVLTGDIGQIDSLHLDAVSNGLSVAVEAFRSQPISGHITLTKGERSELATIAAKLLG